MAATIERYCYNCASAGHLGDDCTRPRPLYVRGGRIGLVVSAFGEGNVPEWVERPNRALPNQKATRKLKRKAKQLEEENETKDDDGGDDDDDDDDDGWFGDQPREAPKPARKIGGIKLGDPKRRKAVNPAEPGWTGTRDRFIPSEDPFPRNASRKLQSRIRSPVRQGAHRAPPVDSYRPINRSVDSYRPRHSSESQHRANYPNTRDLEARINHGSRDKRAQGNNYRKRFS
jgi:hypothetical protein